MRRGHPTAIAIATAVLASAGAVLIPTGPAFAATVPGPPTLVGASLSATTAIVSFVAATDDGGSPIIDHQARCRSVSGEMRTARSTVSPIRVPGLDRAATYQCFVRATNAVGFGPEAGPSNDLVVAADAAPDVELAIGANHSCVRTDLTVRCWGANDSGQLGLGTRGGTRLSPTAIPNVTRATALAAGAAHTCAVLTDATARCWGSNTFGQLGDGTTVTRAKPTVVAGLTGVTALAAGGTHTCALVIDTTVRCWGLAWGLGSGTFTDSTTPVPVVGIRNVVAIAAGGSHTCAVKADGTAWCWGWNSFGQLGDGTLTARPRPVRVTGITDAVGIAAGTNHTCALLADGSVQCWGNGDDGELGDGEKRSFSKVPVTVVRVSTATQVAAGGRHSCVALVDGTARCWGQTVSGQLGDGITDPFRRPSPVIPLDLVDAIAVDAGTSHTCAVRTSGAVSCWGWNGVGQLGDGTTTTRLTPTPTVVF